MFVAPLTSAWFLIDQFFFSKSVAQVSLESIKTGDEIYTKTEIRLHSLLF